jgi:GT2 family glycosyltransferase
MNIRIFSASKDNRFLFAENPTFEAHRKIQANNGIDIQPYLLPNNAIPITQVYNNALNMMRTDESIKGNTDFAFFVHNDVNFELGDAVRRLVEVKDKYDLIGFAGTKKAKISQVPFTWFTGSIPYPDERYGRVIMQETRQESFYNSNNPDVKDTRVALIDGLCMILNRSIIESDMMFDTRFNFDFYDSDFCLECLKRKFRIGVIVLPVFHLSTGESVMTKEFLEPNKAFAEKWGFMEKAFPDAEVNAQES